MGTIAPPAHSQANSRASDRSNDTSSAADSHRPEAVIEVKSTYRRAFPTSVRIEEIDPPNPTRTGPPGAEPPNAAKTATKGHSSLALVATSIFSALLAIALAFAAAPALAY